MFSCNFKHLTAVVILLGMAIAIVQSMPVQRMTRGSSSASSATDPHVVFSNETYSILTDRSTNNPRGLLSVWLEATNLAKENILKAQVSLLSLVRACV